MNPRTLLTWYVVAFILVMFVTAVRGPIREAAWEQPCRDLRAGKAIPGEWPLPTPCPPLGTHRS